MDSWELQVTTARVVLPSRANTIRGYRVLIFGRDTGAKFSAEHFRPFPRLERLAILRFQGSV
jgi:hypothetical protein